MLTNNKTLYGIKDNTERAGLIWWSLTVLLTSVMGDSIILIATVKYKAIKKHKVLIAVMQHMAVCDLLLTLFRVFPVTLTFIYDRWVMGEPLCHVQDNIGWMCAAVTTFLTCALTTLKLITVKFPLKTIVWSSRRGHVICTALWGLVLVLYAPVLGAKMIYLRDKIYFSYNDYECNYNISSPSLPTWYTWYFLIGFPAVTVLSHATLVVTSVLLLVVAKRAGTRHGTTLRWEGVVTVLLTVGVLLLSYLPLTALFVTWLLGASYSATTWRAAATVQYLNIMANFFVYAISVSSFRHFLKSKVFRISTVSAQQKTPLLRRHGLPIEDCGSSQTLAVEIQGLLSEEETRRNALNINDTTL